MVRKQRRAGKKEAGEEERKRVDSFTTFPFNLFVFI